MLLKILRGALLLVSAGRRRRHGWQGMTGHVPPGMAQPWPPWASAGRADRAGLVEPDGAGTLFPATFSAGNVLHAAGILLLLASALRAGNLAFAAIEVPFLLLPLALLWLRYPLR